VIQGEKVVIQINSAPNTAARGHIDRSNIIVVAGYEYGKRIIS